MCLFFLQAMNIAWSVYESNNKTQTIVNSASNETTGMNILTYNEHTINVYNNGTGIYSTESYFILYSSESVNKYSTSICNVFDDSYFTPQTQCTFEIETSVSVNKNNSNTDEAQTAQQTFSLNMTANDVPRGGDCTVYPKFNGSALFDSFNFSCNGWNDSNTPKSGNIIFCMTIHYF